MTYKDFINNILNTRGHFGCGSAYHERHHIVPKCMGGKNTKENLIDLYPKEHYEAHKLLAEENPKNYKLQYAWLCIGFVKGKNTSKRYRVSAEEYNFLKELDSKLASKNFKGEGNPMYGKHHSEETKKKIGKKSEGRYFSSEAKRKISESSKGHLVSQETRNKISSANKGKKFSEDHRKHLSESRIKNKSGFVKVIQYTKSKEFIKEWESIKEASIFLKIPATNITRCCRHKGLKTAGGYIWEYSSEVNKI